MTSRRLLPALLLLFVGSGCAALIYEVVWFQLLQLVIGSSAVSIGVLLGTFMGGMCLGSLLLPRIMSAEHASAAGLRAARARHRRCSACSLLFGMPLVGGVYTAWAGAGVTGILLRGVVAGICLLPPTLLMGATLPAIARWVETTPDGVSWLGFFYGGNIAGRGRRQPARRLLPAARLRHGRSPTYVAVALNVDRRRAWRWSSRDRAARRRARRRATRRDAGRRWPVATCRLRRDRALGLDGARRAR